jgi:site-specific DNA-methyltransferase (adenine-specific)
MDIKFCCEPFTIIRGNSLDLLKELQTKVDCVLTSPPYFKQRVYGDSPEELGQEASIAEYVALLVEVFRSAPVAPWGSFWINMNDKRGRQGGLLNVPERFSIAMQDSGFYLVDKVIWAKEVLEIDGSTYGHCMIDPARRRLNGNGYEYLFHFVKDIKAAWSDLCSIRVPRRGGEDIRYLPKELMQCHTVLDGRTPTNVWRIPTARTNLEHYAMFPPALVERAIAMTCPQFVTEKGPRERLVEWEMYDEGARSKPRKIGKYTKDSIAMSGRQDTARPYIAKKPRMIGWTWSDLPSEPGIVLDPFSGTSTTGEVAIKLGRRYIGIELYNRYADIAVQRCKAAAELRAEYDGRNLK